MKVKVKALFFLLAATIVVAGMKFASESDESTLVGRKAPEIGQGNWINSTPLHLDSLRGKVVLLEFWTFECYNCKHTIPHVKGWYNKFNGSSFTVIGVHTPEFDAEKSFARLKHAVKELGIEYAVVTDNDDRTWDAYRQEYWPAIYLVDKKGIVRYAHIGEGDYDEIEGKITSLLAESD